MFKKILPSLFLIVSLLGFSDAAYLAVAHYEGLVPPCTILVGCEIVTTSKYSLVFNIPVALLGAIYYLIVMVLTVLYLDTKHLTFLHLAALLTPLGLFASIWFMFAQFVIIRALCIYCIGSALTSTALFILAFFVLKQHETAWNRFLRALRLRK